MIDIPEQYCYSRSHDWLEVRSPIRVRLGVTDFAQDLLGMIVFIETPEIGTVLQAGESYGCLESVKTVSDLCAPIAGRVIAVNEHLKQSPELVNESPYQAGWIIELEIESLPTDVMHMSEDNGPRLHQLLTAREYVAYTGEQTEVES
jgi:glycine cleavage system H protein